MRGRRRRSSYKWSFSSSNNDDPTPPLPRLLPPAPVAATAFPLFTSLLRNASSHAPSASRRWQ